MAPLQLPRALAALLLLLLTPAWATQWTITEYYVVRETVSATTNLDQAYEYTYTQTETYRLSKDVTPTATPTLTYTSTNYYEDIEVVELYMDPTDVDTDDILTTTSSGPAPINTRYRQLVVYTAPASCPTPFTLSTYVNIRVPTAVEYQLTVESVLTSTVTFGTYSYTKVEALIPTQVVTTDSDWVESYVAGCTNPTATSRIYDIDTDDGGGSSSGRSAWDECWDDTYCNSLAIYVIVIAAILPALFILGFFESYFWFRRMMIGKYSLRFGTAFWILLLWPVLCFTRQCPSRDDQTQKLLREQWKQVSFGKALGLWLKWGFRHRYPVELLGRHPMYHNPAPPATAQTWAGYGMPGQPPPPPPPGYVYYAPPPAPGQGGQPMMAPVYHPESGAKGPVMEQMPAPPPGMVMYQPPPPGAAGVPYQQPPGAPGPIPSPSAASTPPPPPPVAQSPSPGAPRAPATSPSVHETQSPAATDTPNMQNGDQANR